MGDLEEQMGARAVGMVAAMRGWAARMGEAVMGALAAMWAAAMSERDGATSASCETGRRANRRRGPG